MKCPVCTDTELVISERQGIEIDYCPKCRGVWLDRGELDKIIDRTSQFNNQQQSNSKNESIIDNSKYYNNDYYKRKKRKSFFDDLFDF